MSGETSEITTFCEFGWHQWVYFRDTSVTFPGDKLVIGSYCGPSIYVGPAITVELSSMYSVLYRIPEGDTNKTTIYDREMSYGQTVKPPQTTHNVAH